MPGRSIAAEAFEFGKVFGCIVSADQGHGEALRMVGIVKTKTPFDAKALMVGGAIAAFDANDVFIANLIGEQTPHAAKRAHRIDFTVDRLIAHQGLGQQSAGGANLNALTARHARARAHGILEIENDLAVCASMCMTDDIVDLHLAASANATVALDARIELNHHGGVRVVGCNCRPCKGFQLRSNGNAHAVRPV